MKLGRALFSSGFWHFFTLWVLLGMPLGLRSCGTGKGDSEDSSAQIAPAAEPVEVSLVDLSGTESASPKKSDCKNWFGGIGIEWNLYDGTIMRVYPGYPAARAGLVAGDRIPDERGTIRGAPGTRVLVRGRHSDGSDFTKVLVRAKICVEEEKDDH